MKIKNINISAFGGLEDFSLDFSDGFNVIYGENEDGKSTVMAFIKMMFYGGKGGSKLKTSRAKYIPWSGKAAAGSITFEHSGKSYRIEREFKGSNSTDKVFLFDLDMGTKNAVSSDIGKELFGLSEAAFERSIFIGALGEEKASGEAEGEINAKLSNLSSGGDENISFNKVFSHLEKSKNAISSKKGTAGIMDKNIARLNELTEEYKSAYHRREDIEKLKLKSRNALEKISNLSSELESAKKSLEEIKLSKNREKIREMLDIKVSLDELRAKLTLKDGRAIDEIFVKSVDFSIKKLESIEQKISAKATEEKMLLSNVELLKNPTDDMNEENARAISLQIDSVNKELSALQDRLSEMRSEIDTLNTQQATRGGKAVNPLYMIPALLFTASSIIFFWINILFAAVPLLLAAVLFFVLCFTVSSGANSKKQETEKRIALEKNILSSESEKEKLSSKSALLKEKLNTINMVLNNNTALLEKQEAALVSCREETAKLLKNKAEESAKLLEFFARYEEAESVDEIAQRLEALNEYINNQKQLKQQLNYIAKDLGNISYEQAKEILNSQIGDTVSEFQTEAMDEKCEQLTQLITEEKSQYSSLVTEIKMLEKTTISPDSLSPAISKLREEIASQQDFCCACEYAIDVLQESFSELRKNFGGTLEKKSAEILSFLTNGEYTDMSVSNSFDINVQKNNVFGQKEIDYLSAGTADQAYLSLRLALATLMESNVSLPILLDDPLIQYDDNRALQALSFFDRFSKEHQVILFTCHGFIAENSQQAGSNLLKI